MIFLAARERCFEVVARAFLTQKREYPLAAFAQRFRVRFQNGTRSAGGIERPAQPLLNCIVRHFPLRFGLGKLGLIPYHCLMRFDRKVEVSPSCWLWL